MTEWQPRRLLEAALQTVEARLAGGAVALDLLFERACLLHQIGRDEAARNAYIALLERSPAHFGALNNLGTLAHAGGYRKAAQMAYAEAVRRHPDNPMGHVNLANMLLENGEPAPAREHYEAALRLAPGHPEAHQGLGRLLAELGEEDAGRRHCQAGFQGRPVQTLPYRGAAPPVPVLVLTAAFGGNLPFRPLIDDRTFLASVIAVDFWDPAAPLPPHRLVFNAIGDADRCGPALAAAEAVLARATAPVVNPPGVVRSTGRTAVAARLQRLPHVLAPHMEAVRRELLAGADASDRLAANGFQFPLLLRSPGFHTGEHFLRLEGPEGLPAALGALPGGDLLASQFLDARGPDGWVRKYRVMIVDGQLYPLHLAIARHWKVHYFTAEMAEHPDHRTEEAAFLRDMAGTLGRPAMLALGHIRDALGLDYGGVDFALGPEGAVLLFEANATMVVNPPEVAAPRDRRAAIRRIHDAVREMLLKRAASNFTSGRRPAPPEHPSPVDMD